jgi:hypothetical protein
MTLQQLNHLGGAEKGVGNADTPGGPLLARLGFLVRQFHRAVERQRRADAELEAALERLARRGVIRKIIQEIEP